MKLFHTEHSTVHIKVWLAPGSRRHTWPQQWHRERSLRVISGFRRGENEICTLLGCYAALIDYYRLFGQPSFPFWTVKQFKKKWTAWPLKMGQIGCPETPVTIYKPRVRNTPEQRRYHLHCGRNLKSQKSEDVSTVFSAWTYRECVSAPPSDPGIWY